MTVASVDAVSLSVASSVFPQGVQVAAASLTVAAPHLYTAVGRLDGASLTVVGPFMENAPANDCWVWDGAKEVPANTSVWDGAVEVPASMEVA